MTYRIVSTVVVVLVLGAVQVQAQTTRRAYDMGTYSVTDIWVDPVAGDDARIGADRTTAVRSVDRAWRLIPVNSPSTPFTVTGYRIRLVAGTYPESSLPNYWDLRYGSATAPIIIEAADGPRTVTLQGDINMAQVAYVYLIDLDIVPEPAGDAFHCEACDHVLVRNNRMIGGTWSRTTPSPALAHETIKVNQSTHFYIEDSTIQGAGDNALDFVGVQYGHIVRSRIGNANDWCGYVKGGSAYLVVEGNTFSDCGTGGFTVGQGTGFQFMTSPWLHYEAYGISVINNLVHDVDGAGLGVNGGFNVLLAWNTLVRTGRRSHVLEVVYGARSCDGVSGAPDRVRCSEYLAAGGWGTTVVDDGDNYARIPNRHVFVMNNLIYNPDGLQSEYQHLSVPGPFSGPSQTGSNVAVPAVADSDLRMQGNVIWNGPPTHALGVGDDSGCASANPTCNSTQLLADNSINTVRPVFVNESGGDFRVAPGLLPAPAIVPAFDWTDRPSSPSVPAGTDRDAILVDFNGVPRSSSHHAGAFVPAGAIVSTSPTAVSMTVVKASGSATELEAATPSQRITVRFTPNTAATWTVTTSATWMSVTPMSGTGAGFLTVDVSNPENVIGDATALTGTITITSPASVATVDVRLTVVRAVATTAAPIGVFDTPIHASTVSGSIAVTGWALDDVGINRVEIWRDRIDGDPAPPFLETGHPANGKVFIANGTFVEGTRPDVEALYAANPMRNRAGWGYLLLTQGFPGSNGTFVLTAIAWDQEGKSTVLGTKTITVNNAAATKPFGSIDVPAYGATFSGHNFTFGWALTPASGCTVSGGSRTMTIDSVPASGSTPFGITYGSNRTDIAASFPGFSDSLGAGGAAALDSRTYANGTYQIGWLVYDSCGNGEGIGSRFFTILNSGSDAPGDGAPRDGSPEDSGSLVIRGQGSTFARVGQAVAPSAPLDPSDLLDPSDPSDPLWLVRGVGEVERPMAPGATVWLSQTGRIEIHVTRPGGVPVPGARYEGYLVANGVLRSLPLGSSFDARTGSFYWQPVAGFFGQYALRIDQVRGDTIEQTWEVPIEVGPEGEAPLLQIDRASCESTACVVQGWALDPQSADGAGIGHVHVYGSYRSFGSYGSGHLGTSAPRHFDTPVFLGAAELGVARPDVAQRYGAQFGAAGYSLSVPAMAEGEWLVTVYAWNIRTARWDVARQVTVFRR